MKPKKPARIKGTVIHAYLGAPKLMILPIDNPEALVEQVAKTIREYDNNEGHCDPMYRGQASAALRSIGVPLKRGANK